MAKSQRPVVMDKLSSSVSLCFILNVGINLERVFFIFGNQMY